MSQTFFQKTLGAVKFYAAAAVIGGCGLILLDLFLRWLAS
jgi:hypothetical protein